MAVVPGLSVAVGCTLSSPVGLGMFMYDGVGAGVGFVLWYLSTCGTPAVAGVGVILWSRSTCGTPAVAGFGEHSMSG